MWTGAMTLKAPGENRSFGLVSASSRVDADGLVRIDIAAEVVRVAEDGSAVLIMSESHARELATVVVRSVERIQQLRGLHRLKMLNDAAYTVGSVEEQE